MFLLADEFIRNQEVLNFRLARPGTDSPFVTRGLPFYLDENMSGERDGTLHNCVRELELIRDASVESLHLPLLFPHDELGWHLEIRHYGDATNHNDNRV